jgi:hypothetical protein
VRALRHRSTWVAIARLVIALANVLIGVYIFYLLFRDGIVPAIARFPERPVGLLLSPQVLLDIALGISWLVACDALLLDSSRRRHPWSSRPSKTGSSTSTRTTSPRG